MSSPVTIIADPLPPGFCPLSETDHQIIAATYHGELAGNLNTFNYGNSTPDPSNRDKPWRRLESTGFPDDWYDYAAGFWLAKHPSPPGVVIMFRGNAVDIDTFDGGEAGAITATTGPFWAKVSALDARVPIGPGTLPSTTVIAIGGTGGEEKHILTIPELPAHAHSVDIPQDTATDTQQTLAIQGDDSTFRSFATSSVGSGTAHNTLPPYYGIWFIERTARLYRRRNG
jgi:hypothetical protein